MSNKRDLTGFVRLDASGRVVSGSLILRKKKPSVGKWQLVPTYDCCPDPIPNTGNEKGLRAYVRYDGTNRVIAGSLVLRRGMPTVGRWRQITANQCCDYTTTTTTTIAPTTTTTTTV